MDWLQRIPVVAVLAAVAVFALVVLIIAIAIRRLARSVVAAMWSPDVAVPTYRGWLEVLRRELNRARRYHHPLAVVVMQLAERGVLEENARVHSSSTNRSQWAVMRAGMLLRELLRDTDVVTYDPAENRFVLLLTETTPPQARAAVLRLESLLHERAGATLQSGIAMFPDEGLITEDLVRLAAQQCALAGASSSPGVVVGPAVAPATGLTQSV
jgi:hypothetical protein